MCKFVFFSLHQINYIKIKMSAPPLSQFIAELKTRNIARPNLFYVEIMSPDAFQGNNKLTSMWCHTAHTPHTSIYTNDDYIEAGVRRKYAYDVDSQNLVLNFYVDQDYIVKNFFDTWKKAIVPYHRKFNYPDHYTADFLKLYLIDSEGNATYEYKYSRVFPKTIQSVELNYGSTGTFSTFAVEFVFEDVYYTAVNSEAVDFTSEPPPFKIEKSTVVKNKEIQATETDEPPQVDIMGNITGH